MQPLLGQMQPLPEQQAQGDSLEVCNVQNYAGYRVYPYIYTYIPICIHISWYLDVYNIRLPPSSWSSTP